MNSAEKFRKDLIATGVYAASALRGSARDGGVPGLGDFLNGYLLMALMLEMTEAGEGDFIEIFTEEIKSVDEILASETYRQVRKDIADHVLGEVISDKLAQSRIVAWSGESMMLKLANELKIDKASMLRMVAFGVIATICAVSTPETREENLQIALGVLREKREAGEVVMSASDEELFGEEFCE